MQLDPQVLSSQPSLEDIQNQYQNVDASKPTANTQNPFIPANLPTGPGDSLQSLQAKYAKTPQVPDFSNRLNIIPDSQRYPVVIPGTNYENLYGQGQSTASKWGHALVKTAGIASTTFLNGTLGLINGVGQMAADGKMSSLYDNDFSRSLDSFNKNLENEFPNYYTDKETQANWYSPTNWATANFWADKVVKNLGYAAGAAASGVAWSESLQALGLFSRIASVGKAGEAAAALEEGISAVPQEQALQVSKSVLKNIADKYNISASTLETTQRFVTAGLATHSEAGMEALQGINEFRDKLINDYTQQNGVKPEGEDLEKINKSADSVGNWRYGLNLALLTATNYIQFPKILGSSHAAESALVNGAERETAGLAFDANTRQYINQAAKGLPKFLSKTKRIGSYLFSPSESFEEGAQNAIDLGTKDYFNKQYQNKDADFFDSLKEGVDQTLNSKEGIESILIGGLSGAISENFSPLNFLGKYRENRRIDSNTNTALGQFNNSLLSGYMNDLVGSFNRGAVVQTQRASAIQSGDVINSNDLQFDYLHNYLFPRIKYGRTDLVNDEIESYRQLAMSPDGMTQLQDQGVIGKDVTREQFLATLNDTQDHVRNISEIYKSLLGRYGNTINKETKQRVYSDEAIDHMAYAASKIYDYDKRIPQVSNPLTAAGVPIQNVYDSLRGENTPSEESVKAASEYIDNLDVLSDVKDDLKSNLQQATEMAMRRKEFMRQYDKLKGSPEEYLNEKYGVPEQRQEAADQVDQRNVSTDTKQQATNTLLNISSTDPEINALMDQIDNEEKYNNQKEQLQREQQDQAEKQQAYDQKKQELTDTFNNTPNISSLVNKNNVTYKGRIGQIVQDEDGTYEFNENGTNRYESLGKEDKPISALGVEPTASVLDNIDISDDGKIITIGGIEYQNLFSNPLAAINYDSDGNIQSVRLDTNEKNPKPRVFKKYAEEIAYSILLHSYQTLNDESNPAATELASTIANTDANNVPEGQEQIITGTDTTASAETEQQLADSESDRPTQRDAIDSLLNATNEQELNDAYKNLNSKNKDKYKDFRDTALTHFNTQGKTPAQILAEETAKLEDKKQELNKDEAQIERESGNVATGNPVTDAKSIADSIAEEGYVKPLEKIFISTTGPRTSDSSPEHGSYHQRANKFLNNFEQIPDHQNIRVITVTANNQDELGLSGLISKEINGEGFDSPETGVIRAVFVNGDNFIGVDGKPIGKIGEPTDLNKLIYQGLPNLNLTRASGETRYISTGPNAATEEQALQAQGEWLAKRTNILNQKGIHSYPFSVSRGIPNTGNTSNPVVGTLVTQEDLNSPIITIPITEVRESNGVKYGAIKTQSGERKYFPIGRPLLQKGSILTPLNNRKFTASEQQSIKQVLVEWARGFAKNGSLDKDISQYLQHILYLKRSENPASNQIFLEDGKLNLGGKEMIFTENSIKNNPVVDKFLANALMSVNNTTLNTKQTLPFREIIIDDKGERKDIIWKTYQHYLLSPTFETDSTSENKPEGVRPTNQIPLTTLIDPKKNNNQYTGPFEQKYITLSNFDVKPSTSEQITQTQNESIGTVTNSDVFQQAVENVPSQAAEATLQKVKDFLSKQGITFKEVKNILVNGKKINANGIADIANKLIQVVNGSEATTLPEEAMHFATEIIQRKDPALFKQMLKEISKYKIYQQTVDTYKNNSLYQTDGKPDLVKIKKEAIARLLVENIIQQNEQSTEKPELLEKATSWWSSILDFFKSFFNQNGNPFEQAAKQVNENSLEQTDLNTDNVFLQQGNTSDIFDKIKDIGSQITQVGEQFLFNGQKIANSAAQTIRDLYKGKENKQESKENKDLNSDLTTIFNDLVDNNGELRETPNQTEAKNLSNEQVVEDELRTNLQNRLKGFPEGTRFTFDNNLYDPKTNTTAHTDLIAVEPSGRVNMINFEVLNKAKTSTDAVLNATQRAAILKKLTVAKQVLKNAYNLKERDFNKTQTIPIQTVTIDGEIKGVNIGSPNAKKINKDSLLPIVLKEQTTNNRDKDELIKNLNKQLDVLRGQKVSVGKRAEQNQKIAQATRAIRHLQIKDSTFEFTQQGLAKMVQAQNIIDQYNALDKDNLTDEERKDIQSKLLDLYHSVDDYANADIILGQGLNRSKPDDQVTLRNLSRLSQNSREFKRLAEQAIKGFASDVIAKGVGIENLLKRENVVNWIKKNFRAFSTSATAATKVLYEKIAPIQHRLKTQSHERLVALQPLSKRFTDWAVPKGDTGKNMFNSLLEQNDGKWTGDFIPVINRDFSDKIDALATQGKTEEVKNNIKLQEYQDWYKAAKKERFEAIDNEVYYEDEILNKEKQDEQKQNFEEEYDIDNYKSALNNSKLKEFASEDNYSDQYKELLKSENAPALEAYNYFRALNARAAEIGMLNQYQQNTFVPNIRVSFFDALAMGKITNPATDLVHDLSINQTDQIYGAIDPKTNQVIDQVPAFYMNSLGTIVLDENGKEYTDFSQKSTDLFKVYQLFGDQVDKYEALTDIEDEVKLLRIAESLKGAYLTNKFGKVQLDENGEKIVTKDNINNTKYLDNFINYYLYGKHTIKESEIDAKINVGLTKTAKAINNAVGAKIFSEKEANISVAKTFDKLGRYFQQKTLGLNLASSISNVFGGNFHVILQAGKEFSTAEFFGNELRMTSGIAGWTSEEGKLRAGMMAYFGLLPEEFGKVNANKLSVSAASKFLSSDVLFTLQRAGDKIIGGAIALSMAQNYMVRDGKLVNIRDFVASHYDYENRYNLSEGDRKALEAKIDTETKALKQTDSLDKKAKIVNDELVIEGLDREDKSVYNFASKAASIATDALGIDPDDRRQINMTLLGRSMMTFKNWIPRLLDQRISELKYNSKSQSYEWGRFRMFYQLFSEGALNSVNNLMGTLNGTEDGVDFIKRVYEKRATQYEDANGEPFNMSEADFIDMYRNGIKSQLREAAIFASCMGILLAAKAHVPDKDDESKGVFKWSLRQIDKITDELAFFYSPAQILNIANGSLFPALGTLTDFTKVISHTGKDIFGIVTGDEKLQKSAHPLKYAFKAFPITKEMSQYIYIFNTDVAKELGIDINTNSNQH